MSDHEEIADRRELFDCVITVEKSDVNIHTASLEMVKRVTITWSEIDLKER